MGKNRFVSRSREARDRLRLDAKRAAAAAGIITVMVFGMGPTCYQENGAACGTAGLACPAGQTQVCQDKCVPKLNQFAPSLRVV